jgi:hypothetical protein
MQRLFNTKMIKALMRDRLKTAFNAHKKDKVS